METVETQKDFTSTDENPYVNMFEMFFETVYKKEIERLVENYPDKRSLDIDFKKLEKFDFELADDLIEKPDYVIDAANVAIRKIDVPAIELEDFAPHLRFCNLPKDRIPLIREISAKHLNKMIAVEGIIREITDVFPKLKVATWQCRRCGNTYKIQQEGNQITQPSFCECKHKDFTLVAEKSEFVDFQRIQIQEPLEQIKGNEQPSQLHIYVSDDIVNRVFAGNKTKFSGILRLSEPKKEKKAVYGRYLETIHLEETQKDFADVDITPEEEAEIKLLAQDPKVYDKLIASLAPSIYGHEIVKEAIIMQLFGGVKKNMPDKSTIRGNIHILLIGDPGAAKCVSGDTEIYFSDGTIQKMQDFAENIFSKTEAVLLDDGFYADKTFDIPIMDENCRLIKGQGARIYKRKPNAMYEIRTATGKTMRVTNTHPLFVCKEGKVKAVRTENLKSGEFIATPRKVDVTGEDVKLQKGKKGKTNALHITAPELLDAKVARFYGYMLAEGYALKRKKATTHIRFTNNDDDIIEDFIKCANIFSIKPKEINKEGAREIAHDSRELGNFFEENFPELMMKSSKKIISQKILRSKKEIVKEFLKAFIEGEGHISKRDRTIEITSASENIADRLQALLLRFGIVSSKKEIMSCATNSKMPKLRKYFKITIDGEFTCKYIREIDFISERKQNLAKKVMTLEKTFNTNIDVVPNMSEELKFIRKTLGLRQRDIGLMRSTYQHYERGDRNPGRDKLQVIAVELLKHYVDSTIIDNKVEDKILNLVKLANADIFWDKITGMKKIETDEWVYDFEVIGTHNFITNLVFSHNSMMLLATNKIAPKSIYVAGKTTTGAGIAASAVKDEFGEGGWTLKAGALVLASGGLAAIDEFDKMDADDRSALHEALEQQSYHKDFEIMLANGETKKIGKLVDDLIENNPEKLVFGKDCEILPVDDLQLITTDFEKVYHINADRVSRHKAPSHFIEIEYSNSGKIKVTPEHPIFVFNKENCFEEVLAEKINERMFCPAIRNNHEAEEKIEVITEIKNDNGLEKELEKLERFISPELKLVWVKKVERIPNTDSEWVYDVTVEPTKTFISGGLVLHNTVSVAKAGIIARFKTETSVLAAANPKFSRFDPYTPFMEQINLPPTLVSRFDLFFMIRDVLDKTRDKEIADHILRSHRLGEMLYRSQKTETTDLQVLKEIEDIATPPIDPELFSKYISYARQHVFPVLSDDAIKAITEFYVNLRDMGRKEGSYSATHRQLEGLVRMAEASARVRLSYTVDMEDAERAIRLLRTALQELVTDPETGKIDFDIIATGQSHSKVASMKKILGIIKEKAMEMDMVPVSDVLEEAKTQGIDKDKAMDLLSQLQKEGEIYRPRNNFVRPVQRNK
ncbi:MAG: LAGLIDADG family homing endonuclease [Candidatus Diapherotrites archaeon]